LRPRFLLGAIAEADQAADRAGVDPGEADLLLAGEFEFAEEGGVVERGREPIRGNIRGRGKRYVGLFLKDGSAAPTPLGGHHFFDEGKLGLIRRPETLQVSAAELLEQAGILATQNYCPGEKSVGDGVLRRACLALWSFGTARFGAVGARRGDAFFGRWHCVVTGSRRAAAEGDTCRETAARLGNACGSRSNRSSFRSEADHHSGGARAGIRSEGMLAFRLCGKVIAFVNLRPSSEAKRKLVEPATKGCGERTACPFAAHESAHRAWPTLRI